MMINPMAYSSFPEIVLWVACGTIFLSVLIAILVMRSFLPKYITEKGKNATTHENSCKSTCTVERVHSSKFQFEKEYELYEKLWARLLELNSSVGQLRPILDHIEEKQDPMERWKKRLTRFYNAQKTFDTLFKSARPFYPQEIFNVLHEINVIAHAEAEEYQVWERRETKPADYYDRGQKNIQALEEKIEVVCREIRKRVGG